ncbi:MAG: Gfo/Idh/MocA family oxidoreductase [Planctomycetes bacterium]|nr:Gfo/Idh/MocA family oxidoreductase [Planctomycetota bacterium]
MSIKTWSMGVYGAGMIGEIHIRAIKVMKGAALAGVFDRNQERAKQLAEKYSCRAYESEEEFFGDANLDIVTIGTPTGAHRDPAIQAAENGKHVICEKPMEVDLERVDEMINACAKNDVMLCGVFPRRFHPVMAVVKSAVESGRFKKLAFAGASIPWWRPQEYYDSGSWRGTWALDGGGALMNQGIHTIDLLQYFAGPISSVQALAGCLAHENIEVEDHAVALVQFESGAQGVIEGSTCCYPGFPASIKIYGSGGTAVLEDVALSQWHFADSNEDDEKLLEQYGTAGADGGAGASDPNAIPDEWHQWNFEEALAALNEKREPTVNGKEARKAVEIIKAIYHSAQNGSKVVSLPYNPA